MPSKYAASLRVSARQPAPKRPLPRMCPCGCEREFVPRQYDQIYYSATHRFRHDRAKRRAKAGRQPRLCLCGCRVKFTPRRVGHIYATKACKWKANNAKAKERQKRRRLIGRAPKFTSRPSDGPTVDAPQRARNRAKLDELMRKVAAGEVVPKVVPPDQFEL